jgi:hypothetical protein
MGGACSADGGGEILESRVLVGKPERKRPLGRPGRRGEDNIRIFRKWDVGVWTGLGWLRIKMGGGQL